MAEGPRDALVSRFCKYKISLSCGIICVILCLAVFRHYRSVIKHTHTDKRTERYTTTTCTALSIASRGKNRPYCTAHQV